MRLFISDTGLNVFTSWSKYISILLLQVPFHWLTLVELYQLVQINLHRQKSHQQCFYDNAWITCVVLSWTVVIKSNIWGLQGGHGTGKTGNLVLTFSRQGKHREFCCNTGKVFETQGKYFDNIHWCKKHVSLHIFSIFFASLHSA